MYVFAHHDSCHDSCVMTRRSALTVPRLRTSEFKCHPGSYATLVDCGITVAYSTGVSRCDLDLTCCHVSSVDALCCVIYLPNHHVSSVLYCIRIQLVYICQSVRSVLNLGDLAVRCCLI